MYQVSVTEHFDAAHYLRGYRGKCEDLHGHRFQVAVTVQAVALGETGIAFDFAELRRHLREVLGRFDHTCLNDVSPFDCINPSSENIATTVYQELSGRLESVTISRVEVWESPESSVAYVP